MGTYAVVFVLEEVRRLADVSLRDVGKACVNPFNSIFGLEVLQVVF